MSSPNEIESIYEYHVEKLKNKLQQLHEWSQACRIQGGNGTAWLTMVSQIKELQAMHSRLEMLAMEISCAVERRSPHEGCDG